MRVFIKLVLIVLIVLFAFFNYKYISFDKGISQRSMGNKSVGEFLQTLSGIKSIQYYKKTITLPQSSEDYIYKVYIVTTEEAYLLDATQDDIDAFNVLGIFSSSLKPELIKPIPFYVEIILGVIILIIPFGRKRRS